MKKLRKEIDEKGRLICNLQDSMRKAKEFEVSSSNSIWNWSRPKGSRNVHDV